MTDNNGNLKKQEVYIPNDDQVSSYDNYAQFYEYDSLNRLLSARENKFGGTTNWQQQYVYDRYGNRTIDQTNTWGTGIPKPNFSVGTTANRLTAPGGYTMSYDSAGNLTTDTYTGEGTRTFDAENRMKQAWANSQWQTYTYDGNGQRVKRNVNGTETSQVYGVGGELLAEYAANGAPSSPQKEYGYRNGQLLITAESSANIHYLVTDQLGTPRMILDQSGSLANVSRHDYLPFGEELGVNVGGRTQAQGYGQADGTRQQFTGQQRDNETGLDYFGARYYASMQGRFVSTDPVLSSGHPMNPQSWNRYSYVGNNPLKLTDPNGEMWVYHYLDDEHKRIGIAWIEGNKIPQNLRAQGYQALNFGGSSSRDVALTNGSVVRLSATSKNPLQLRGPESGGDRGYVNAGLINEFGRQTAPMPAATAAFILVSLNGGYAVAGSSIALLDAAAFALSAAHEQGQNDAAVMGRTSTLYDDSGTSKSLKYHGIRQIETDVTKSEFIDNLVQSGYKMSKQGNETVLEKGGSRYTVYDVARSTSNPAASLNIGGAGESVKIRLKP